MADSLLHEKLALVLHGCLHVCLIYRVIIQFAGFLILDPFSPRSWRLPLGFILNLMQRCCPMHWDLDWIRTAYSSYSRIYWNQNSSIKKENVNNLSFYHPYCPCLTISLLVYGVAEFSDKMASFAGKLILSFGQKDSRKAVGRFGGSMDKTDCSRIFRAKKHKILEND